MLVSWWLLPATGSDVRVYSTALLRRELLARFPGLAGNPGYRRLLAYLVSGGQRDDETGEPVIPAALLAEFEGRVAQHAARNHVAKDFLEGFRRDVLPEFEFSEGWSYAEEKARVVTRLGVPEDVLALWHAAASDVLGGGVEVVELVSGRRRTRRVEAEDDRVELARAWAALASVSHVADETRAVIGYHNGLSRNSFSRVVRRHWDEAVGVARGLAEESRAVTELALADIGWFPKPLLRPVENSARAYSLRPSLLTVKSSVRRVLTQDWVEYDLKGAQFAIVARLWRIPELQAFLASGASVWATLLGELGLPVSVKRKVKDAVYSLVFGGGLRTERVAESSGGKLRKGIAERLDEETGVPGVGERFLALPLIRAVYEAREREIDHLVFEAFEAWTVFGKRLPIPVGSYERRREAARKALAQQAQAVELLLLMPVYELASETDQFTVMLYQFDGVTVKYRDRRTCAYWHERITSAVADAAERVRVQTRLEWEVGAAFAWPLV